MIIQKKCVPCSLPKEACHGCSEPCIIFDDGRPYIDIPLDSGLVKISIDEMDVFDIETDDIHYDDEIVYFYPDSDEIRIFASREYEILTIQYDDGEVN